MSDQDQTQNIRTILLKDWDPLIVGDNPYLADEYDGYIPEIIHMLANHCTVKQLEEHLAWIEKERMWLPSLTRGIPQTAKALISSWKT